MVVTGDIVYTADDWDNGIYSSKAKAYGDVLYGMLVRLPENAENERKSPERPCKWNLLAGWGDLPSLF